MSSNTNSIKEPLIVCGSVLAAVLLVPALLGDALNHATGRYDQPKPHETISVYFNGNSDGQCNKLNVEPRQRIDTNPSVTVIGARGKFYACPALTVK